MMAGGLLLSDKGSGEERHTTFKRLSAQSGDKHLLLKYHQNSLNTAKLFYFLKTVF
jgi:hypothetical protein